MLKLSIGIVALNEEKYLPTLLNDLLNQTYDHSYLEILLIDSMSLDNTKQLMFEFKNKYHNEFAGIQILDNPNKIQSSGWNIAINHFTGDSLTRIDAHSRIDKDFCKYVFDNLTSGEYVVGGKRPCIVEKETKWSNILLQVENSLFGSNVLKSRSSDKKQYVKTMFHATYKREVFERVGLFNESLLRTEDNEFHYRISKAGFKLLYDPRIVSFQYIRASFKKMVKQKYGNGFWIGKTVKKCPRCLSIYHFAPFLFIILIISSTVLAPFGIWLPSVILWGLYFLFAFLTSFISAIQNRLTLYHFLMPFLFLILHVCYGFGTLIGLVFSW